MNIINESCEKCEKINFCEQDEIFENEWKTEMCDNLQKSDSNILKTWKMGDVWRNLSRWKMYEKVWNLWNSVNIFENVWKNKLFKKCEDVWKLNKKCVNNVE